MAASSFLSKRDSAALILAVGAFFICVTMGIRQSFGLYLTPYTSDFGIELDTFSFAIALQNIMWGILSPVFGSLADRRGAPIAAAIGAGFYTIGALVMAAATSGGTLVLGQGFIGVGLAGAGFSVILGAVGKASSDAKRPINLAIVGAAGSFGQFALVPLAQWAMSAWGAKESLILMSCFAGAMLLLAPLLKLPATAAAASAPVADKNTAVLKTAFASPSYVLLFLGFFVCGFQLVFIATYLPSYITEFALDASVAAIALAMIGLFNIAGSLFWGWSGTRILKKDSLTALYAIRSLVIIAFLIAPKSSLSVIVFGAAMGFLWLGTVPLTSSLIAVFFGTRHMSMLYGFVFFSHQLGSFCGAWLGGILYKATDSYDIGWYLCIALGFIAAALHAPIKEKLDAPFAARFSS